MQGSLCCGPAPFPIGRGDPVADSSCSRPLTYWRPHVSGAGTYVKIFTFGKRVWFRGSCQLYNDIQDFKHVAEAISNLICKPVSSFWLRFTALLGSDSSTSAAASPLED